MYLQNSFYFILVGFKGEFLLAEGIQLHEVQVHWLFLVHVNSPIWWTYADSLSSGCNGLIRTCENEVIYKCEGGPH